MMDTCQNFHKIIADSEVARIEFERTRIAYNYLYSSQHVRVVKPIKIETAPDKTIIVFERIPDGYAPLSDVVCSPSFRGLKRPADLFYKVGQSIGEFHCLLNPCKDIATDDLQLHGDFHRNNIFIKDSHHPVFLIDLSPPKDTRYLSTDNAKWLHDSQGLFYKDLACFLTRIETKYPLKKIFLAARYSKKAIISAFLMGYEDYTGVVIDTVQLIKHKIKAYKGLMEDCDKRLPVWKWKIWKLIYLMKIYQLKYAGQMRDYRRYFSSPFAPTRYEEVYREGSYDSEVWRSEQVILKSILARYSMESSTNIQCLDFACGTGRILTFLESQGISCDGIDISRRMLAIAKMKSPGARLMQMDLTEDAKILRKSYDIITAFRFFLNAEPDLRRKAMKALQSKLNKNGILIMNIHGNTFSLRMPVVILARLFGKRLNHLSVSLVKQFAKESGLQVAEVHPGCFLPRYSYKLLPLNIWRVLENLLRGIPIINKFSIDLLLVLKRTSVS